MQNKLECFEKCFARLMGKFWGMTVTKLLGTIDEKKKELTSKQTRAAEIHQKIDALRRQIATLDSELESITKEESCFIDEVLKPAQATVEQTTGDALAVAEELMTVEGKLEKLKAHADTLEPTSLHYNFELKSFQSKFGQLGGHLPKTLSFLSIGRMTLQTRSSTTNTLPFTFLL